MAKLESVIGLEVHVQIKTNSKIFCACPTDFGSKPNTQICPVCSGYPGVLPVLNKKAVDSLLKAALALNCRINKSSIFARKQYFYPDLPKAYQISQYELPLAEEGVLSLGEEFGNREIRIHRIHLEEDAGKLVHTIGSRVLDHSLVDLNRTGIPLMEIVSEPEISSPEEAVEYVMRLRSIVRYLGVSDGDMEKGSMRCDANISMRPVGVKTLGTKAEVKNINSIRGVKEALYHEIKRQSEVIESGERVVQETRLWDQEKGVTQSMRSKEEAHDYRYFPDPDLIPMVFEEGTLQEIKKNLPELPEDRKRRYINDLALSSYDAGVITSEKLLADYFESGLVTFQKEERGKAAKPLANFLTNDLLGRLNVDKKSISESPISPEHLASLVMLIQKGTISSKIAKTVFEDMFQGKGAPEEIVKQKGLVQVEDEGEILQWVEEVIASNEKAVQDVRSGKQEAIGSLVGGVMKKSKGKANPKIVNKILREKLLHK